MSAVKASSGLFVHLPGARVIIIVCVASVLVAGSVMTLSLSRPDRSTNEWEGQYIAAAWMAWPFSFALLLFPILTLSRAFSSSKSMRGTSSHHHATSRQQQDGNNRVFLDRYQIDEDSESSFVSGPELQCSTSRPPLSSASDDASEIYLPEVAYGLFRGLARKLGSGAKGALSLGSKLGSMSLLRGQSRDVHPHEVPWKQTQRRRTSFGGRSDRASRASSFGSSNSDQSAPITSFPSPYSSPSKGPSQGTGSNRKGSSYAHTRQRRPPTMTRIISGQDLMELESHHGNRTVDSDPSQCGIDDGRRTGGAYRPNSLSNGPHQNHRHSFPPPSSLSNETNGGHGSMQANEPFVYNGHLAVDCLPFDTTEPLFNEVKQIVTDSHLLQFGCIIGESSAELALGLRGAPPPVTLPSPQSSMRSADGSVIMHEESLYGYVDNLDAYARGWEKIVEEHKDGLHYWVHRRSLRRGLYMYKSRAVYERGSTADMVAFSFSNHDTRRRWDDSSTAFQAIGPPSWRGNGSQSSRISATGTSLGQSMDLEEEDSRLIASSSYAQSSFMYARNRFPPPMAQREYLYARRIWYKADDGGCYCIAKGCPLGPLTSPVAPIAGCRTVRVRDFATGFVIRAVPGIYHREGAVEVVTNYFEDSCAQSGIINMAVRKALWPITQKNETAFRKYQAALSSNALHLPYRRRPPFDSPPPPPPSRLPSKIDDDTLLEEEDSEGDLVDARCVLSPRDPPSAPSPFSSQLPVGLAEIDPNVSMFSGYRPRLSRSRLHLTPILYAFYLLVMRVASLPLLIPQFFQVLLVMLTSSSKSGRGGSTRSPSSCSPPGSVTSSKADDEPQNLSLKRAFTQNSSLHDIKGPRSNPKSQGGGGMMRKIASLAITAARAITVPLLHQKFSSDAIARRAQGVNGGGKQGVGGNRVALTSSHQNKGSSKLPRTKAFLRAMLGQQLTDEMRTDFFYY